MTRMFDFDDFYDQIARELPDDCRVCEVGVADGDSAIFLAQKLIQYNKNFKLYMVDNMDYGGFIQMKTIYENAVKMGVAEFIELVPYESVKAASLFNDNFLDFVFIDASHLYQHTINDIKAWYPKLKDERKLAGHDYFSYSGVQRAVDETIPVLIKRNDIPDRDFDPERFLNTEQTRNGNGVWWCEKNFYKSIKL